MSLIYPSQSLFPRWRWLISFRDLTDEVIKKLGDNKIVQNPDPQLITIPASSSTTIDDPSILTVSSDGTPAGELKLTNINTTAAITVSHMNYYYNTAKALIDLANQKGVDESQINSVWPMHYILIQWQIAYLTEQVCMDNIGLNDNVDVHADKYKAKTALYHDKLIAFQGKISYEMFNTAAMQQTFTRAPNRTFDIIY